MSKGKFALGAILGMAAGVVAGILTAPKSGKETRADLKAKADQMKADAELKAADLKAKGQQVYSDTRKQVETVVDDGKRTVVDYRERAGRAFNSARAEFKAEDEKKQKS